MPETRYIRPANEKGETFGVWSFDGKTALRMGVPNPENHPSCCIKVESESELIKKMSENLKDVFKEGAVDRIIDMVLKPGEYYPRMARPTANYPDDPPSYPQPKKYEYEIANSKGQLSSLIFRLQQICQTLHPSEENYTSYGHEIRNLLILACTEVEAQWKGVLKAHEIVGKDTSDYVKLNKAMHLNEYSILLTHYPWLPEFCPFKDWQIDLPTQSLNWYDAYNKVKHDRELNFTKATLIHAINAVCANIIMLYAQFGRQQITKGRHEIAYFFEVVKFPKWLLSESYISPYDAHSEELKLIYYQF